MQKLAPLRARGCPWDHLTGRMGRTRPELEKLLADPAYRPLLLRQQAEVLDEMFAESVTVLQEALWRSSERSETRAAESLLKVWATVYRHRARPPARRPPRPATAPRAAARQSAPRSPGAVFITSASSTVA